MAIFNSHVKLPEGNNNHIEKKERKKINVFPSHEILIGFYMFLLVSNGVPTRQWDRPRVVSPIFSLLKLVGFPN